MGPSSSRKPSRSEPSVFPPAATPRNYDQPTQRDETDIRRASVGPPPAQPSVLLADDEPDLLFLLERLLQREGFEVVGTASDGAEAITMVADAQPDIALLDLAMPTLDGEAAVPQLVLEAPTTMVVILTAHVTGEQARSLFHLGAFAVLDKAEVSTIAMSLRHELANFRRALEGEDTMPRHHFRQR